MGLLLVLGHERRCCGLSMHTCCRLYMRTDPKIGLGSGAYNKEGVGGALGCRDRLLIYWRADLFPSESHAAW